MADWAVDRTVQRAEGYVPRRLPLVSRAVRVTAVVEAASWAGLLAGMFVKYALGGDDALVRWFGGIHGIVVLLYVVAVLVAARQLRWGSRTQMLALLASVPPFGTVAFESWAYHTGRLEQHDLPVDELARV